MEFNLSILAFILAIMAVLSFFWGYFFILPKNKQFAEFLLKSAIKMATLAFFFYFIYSMVNE